MRCWLLLIIVVLAGCCSHELPPNGRLSDSITVTVRLNDQLSQWRCPPYHYGGMSRGGIDCSGFVYITFRDRFDLQLPRAMVTQTDIGTRISKDELLPGDLIFFKTGGRENGLHAGLYDIDNQFIHASTRQGIIHSPLNNVYWRKVFWQARLI